MIQWVLAFAILGADGAPIAMHEALSDEAACKKMAHSMRYGEEFLANIDGIDTRAKFLFCLRAENGIIIDYAKQPESK